MESGTGDEETEREAHGLHVLKIGVGREAVLIL